MKDTLTDISRVLAGIRDEKLMNEFLTQLLTESEASRISRRWELVVLLDRGVPQRVISEQLGLSLCNITRGSRELKKTDSAFREVLVRFVSS